MRTARSCRRTTGRSAMCSRKRACFRISRSGAIFCSARRATAAAAKPAIGCDEVVELLGLARLLDRAHAIFRAASASGSRSAARCCRSRKLLLMDEPLSALDRGDQERDPAVSRAAARPAQPAGGLHHARHGRGRAPGRPDGADGKRPRDRRRGARRLAERSVLAACGCARRRGELDGVVQASDEAYGLVTLKVRGGSLIVPAPPAPVGERRRLRVIAGDVSLTREAPGPSSILNVLPARIVSMKSVGSNEIIVVVALARTAPARACCRA